MCNPFEAAGTTYGQYGNFGAPQAPKSGPNHEKMRALCSTIITWSRKITKTVPAFKNCHGLKITRLGLPSTLCYACTSSRPIPLLTAVPTTHASIYYLVVPSLYQIIMHCSAVPKTVTYQEDCGAFARLQRPK